MAELEVLLDRPPEPFLELIDIPVPPMELLADTEDSMVPSNPKKRKWARKQAAEPASAKFQRAEGQNEYNIWYGKFLGDYKHVRTPATTRCVPERDAGLTKADYTNPNTYVCIYFAKGCCMNGKSCKFLHRVPTPADSARLDLLHDVFGRTRHASDREDMGGVGSFNREGRTLLVSDIQVGSSRQLQDVLRRHFSAFGEIESVSIKPKNAGAFVKFKYRANAEFAKIAMADQSLDGDEMINVRWAPDDDDAQAKKNLQMQREQSVLQALVSKGYSAEPNHSHSSGSDIPAIGPVSSGGPGAEDEAAKALRDLSTSLELIDSRLQSSATE